MLDRVQIWTLVVLSGLVLGVVLVVGQDRIDCQAPSTWSTASGVQHCAINGGK